jgi:hypothetical protein
MVAAYYQTVGWPTFLPTAEQAMFAGKVRGHAAECSSSGSSSSSNKVR